MIPYTTPVSQLITALSSDARQGLDAGQIPDLLARYGENRLKEARKKSLARRFFDQFRDTMILILIAAAFVSFAVALRHGQAGEFLEPALILLIVALNAAMGVLQESRAEKALDALKNLSAPHARVIRGGKEHIIDAVHLVPGDIILLEAGDFVPADGRLLAASSLKCDESSLTGESVPAEKDSDFQAEETTPLADRKNMIFAGCSVTYGSGRAIVTATGMDTEIGKIAGLLNQAQEEATPLQKKLSALGRTLGILALFACTVIFFTGLLNSIPVMDIFMNAVSLAVSAIPEGLPAVVTVVLSIGVQRMVKHGAIIRRLPAVETLGSASVICSDKTGTLTQNKMTLTRLWAEGAGPEDAGGQLSPAALRLLSLAALCCDASVRQEEGKTVEIGDATETAIVAAALQKGMAKETLEAQRPRLAQLPFDSQRKLMTTVHQDGAQKLIIVKGAFDMLRPRCVPGSLEEADRVNSQMAGQALRVLGVACRTADELPEPFNSETVETGLTFLGLLGMIDPPRPEVKEAVSLCRQAGIRPVMITGDQAATASAIARELGILTDSETAVTGQQLKEMPEEELDKKISRIAVYARVTPEDKIRIVRAWQRQGAVTAMTGDGVNDAPALKAADIGCAMGITGTDVAKNAADLTLTDDNFTTIVEAVRQGRGIYDNIRKVVGFLLGTNIGEVIAVFAAMLLWHESPLLSVHLLWINLVTDSLPAIALGMEPVEPDVMERPPRSREEGIFSCGLGIQVILQGFLFAFLCLAAFAHGRQATGQLAGGRTMAFLVLALSQVMQAFNMRSHQSLFRTGLFTNRPLTIAAAISLLLVAAVSLTPLASAFQLLPLTLPLYARAILLALLPTALMEAAKGLKWIRR